MKNNSIKKTEFQIKKIIPESSHHSGWDVSGYIGSNLGKPKISNLRNYAAPINTKLIDIIKSTVWHDKLYYVLLFIIAY